MFFTTSPISSSVINAPWILTSCEPAGAWNSISPFPNRVSAPFWSSILRESVLDANRNEYKWTGHSVLMGNSKREFQIVDDVLGRFASRAGPARRALVEFMGENGAIEDKKTFGGEIC